MSSQSTGPSPLLTPREQRIIDLLEDVTAEIAELVEEEAGAGPFGEFDERVMLEHAQVIQRYVLAQAAARAYPNRYRLIGHSAPGWDAAPADDTHTHDTHAHDPDAPDHHHHDFHGFDHDQDDDHEWQWEPIEDADTAAPRAASAEPPAN